MLKEVGSGERYIRSTTLHGFAETVNLAGWDAQALLVEAGIPAHVLQGEETLISWQKGAVAEVVGIEVGVVSWVLNLESSGAGTPEMETTP